MRYGFFISGEFPELGFLEVENLLRPHSKNFRILRKDGRIMIVESNTLENDFFSRLAMIRESFIHLKTVELNDLEVAFKELSFDFDDKRICVRVKRVKKESDSRSLEIKSPELERKLGALLWKKGVKIGLKSPDAIVKVYISEKCHIGILNHVTGTKQFWERRPDRKPFFRPGALLPRLARALVNLTGIKDGSLLDPMCGTGTILIEAGLMGINFCGVEAFPKVAYGCATNLRHYNLSLNLFLGDVRKLPFVDSSFDAVVTDYPYLRSSKSFGDLGELYEKSIFEIDRVLKPGKKAVLISNRDLEDFLESFSLEAKLIQRVHRNLYRRIYLVKKIR